MDHERVIFLHCPINTSSLPLRIYRRGRKETAKGGSKVNCEFFSESEFSELKDWQDRYRVCRPEKS
jgi:hypothetical protein